MGTVEQRLDQLEKIIRKPAFRQNKGLGNEVGYYIFDYAPCDELIVRERVKYIEQKHVNGIDGFNPEYKEIKKSEAISAFLRISPLCVFCIVQNRAITK